MATNLIYLASAIGFDRVKIGFWRTDIAALKQRYVTFYGNDMSLYYFTTVVDCEYFETVMKLQFVSHNICNELYKKEYLDHYLNFMKEYSQKSRSEIDLLFESLTQGTVVRGRREGTSKGRPKFPIHVSVKGLLIYGGYCEDPELVKPLREKLKADISKNYISDIEYIIEFTADVLLKWMQTHTLESCSNKLDINDMYQRILVHYPKLNKNFFSLQRFVCLLKRLYGDKVEKYKNLHGYTWNV